MSYEQDVEDLFIDKTVFLSFRLPQLMEAEPTFSVHVTGWAYASQSETLDNCLPCQGQTVVQDSF